VGNKKQTPPDELTLQRILKAWWEEAVEHGTHVPIDPKRQEFLRASGLPFCSVKEGYKRLVNGLEKERFVSFGSDYYFDIGHAIHNLAQNYVGRLKEKSNTESPVLVLGHWKCPKCKDMRRFTTYKPCKCGGVPRYVEIEIKWRTTVGHIDKVIRIGNLLFILDYKSCGTFALQKHRKAQPDQSDLPYLSNRCQIKRYVGLFEQVFAKEFKHNGKFEGCTVAGAILAYLSRETVNQKEFVYLPASDRNKMKWYKKAEKDDRLFVVMAKAVKTRSIKLMEQLVNEKPCRDYDHYLKVMHNRYSECPLAKDGTCFKHKKLMARLKQAVDDPESLQEKLEEY
jgi:hypothetical protein